MGRRVLVTGLGTFWGGRVAQALEADPDVDVVVGLDREEPTVALNTHATASTSIGRSAFGRLPDSSSIPPAAPTPVSVPSVSRKLIRNSVSSTGRRLSFSTPTTSS